MSWSTVAPTACAIHCASTPLLLVFAPTFIHETTLEWSLLALTVLIAAFVLTGGRRAHGGIQPVLVTSIGVALWAASLLGVFQPIPEDVSTPMAALTAAAGFLLNARMHRAERGDPCACSGG